MMRITVIASKTALDALGALLAAYRKHHTLSIVEINNRVPESDKLSKFASRADALLLVGERRRSPRTVLPGPLLPCDDGRLVPVGWLPEVDTQALATFAKGAASVHRRRDTQPEKEVMAVLSQWHPQFLNLSGRIRGLLVNNGNRAVMRWEADQLLREDMVTGLGCGLAAAFYVGHGRPVGWVGYHGTRAHHFQPFGAHPVGVLFSLCCETASRRRNGLSFSEAIPLMGGAAACFAAVKPILHSDNTRWALGLCQGINMGATNMAELISGAIPTSASALAGYRILGDPLAPFATHSDAYFKAQKIGKYDEYLTA